MWGESRMTSRIPPFPPSEVTEISLPGGADSREIAKVEALGGGGGWT